MPRPTKGERTPGSGRAPGVLNRTTREVREALVEAFDRLGGVEYLVGIGQSDPPTFARLLARLVPAELALKGDLEATVLRVVDRSDQSRA